MIYKYKSDLFPEQAPTFLDLRLGVTACSLVLLLVALVVREGRAFGLPAGLDPKDWSIGLAWLETLTATAGLALSALASMAYWDGRVRLSWETVGIMAAALLEGIASYISGALTTGDIDQAWLYNERVTVALLGIFLVVIWLTEARVLSVAYSRYLADEAGWNERGAAWVNDRRSEERLKREKERKERKEEQARIETEQSMTAWERIKRDVEQGTLDLDRVSNQEIAELYDIVPGTVRKYKAKLTTGNGTEAGA